MKFETSPIITDLEHPKFHSRFCMCNIHDINLPVLQFKETIKIDPGVWELTKKLEYSKIEKLHTIASSPMKPNIFISIDYASDMNPEYADLFIKKTNENIQKYQDNPQYIITIQSYFKDVESFKDNFHKNVKYWEGNKYRVIGIGNLCRFKSKSKGEPYTGQTFKFLMRNSHLLKNCEVHIYGLSAYFIRTYVHLLEYKGIKVSVDSCKWVNCHSKKLKTLFGNRSYGSAAFQMGLDYRYVAKKYFWEYIQKLKRNKVNVQY